VNSEGKLVRELKTAMVGRALLDPTPSIRSMDGPLPDQIKPDKHEGGYLSNESVLVNILKFLRDRSACQCSFVRCTAKDSVDPAGLGIRHPTLSEKGYPVSSDSCTRPLIYTHTAVTGIYHLVASLVEGS